MPDAKNKCPKGVAQHPPSTRVAAGLSSFQPGQGFRNSQAKRPDRPAYASRCDDDIYVQEEGVGRPGRRKGGEGRRKTEEGGARRERRQGGERGGSAGRGWREVEGGRSVDGGGERRNPTSPLGVGGLAICVFSLPKTPPSPARGKGVITVPY